MTFGKIGFISILLFCFVCPLFVLSAETGNLDVPPDISAKIPFLGNFHALIIGIDGYKDWGLLRTSVRDAESLRQILIQRYGFSEKNVVLRTNDDATRLRISSDLRNLASNLGKQDNLLIYFSGHGQLDDLTGDGYWIPVEGDLKDPGTWISHSTVKNLLGSEKVNCKNIIVVADSCYAGGLFRESSSPVSPKDTDYREKLLKFSDRRSRQVITTGGFKPVVDGPRGGHSLFGDLFLKALNENTADVVDLENLCYKILWDSVDKISGQTPHIGRFNTSMDDGGLFVLFDRNNFIENEKKRMAEEGKRKEKAQLQAILEERTKLEDERRGFEEEKKALEEKKTIEAERAKIEKETAEKQRLAEERRKEQEQLKTLLEERKKLEAERQSLEEERLSEERKKKEQEQLTALQAEREKLDAEREQLEAQKKALRKKEKIVASMPKEITGTRVVLRHKRIVMNTTQQIQDLVEGHNFFDSHFNPDGNFENHFVDNGNETITDLVTGLMWQKGGSSKAFGDGEGVRIFFKDLNEHRFGGFSDWRLPTLEELASLLEPKKATGKSFVDPVFSELPSSISSDYTDGGKTSSKVPWMVDFENGHITIGLYYRIDWLASALKGASIPHHKQFVHVKAVRSVKQTDRIQKHPQEQLTALQAEREKIEAERVRMEAEKKAREEKEKIIASVPKEITVTRVVLKHKKTVMNTTQQIHDLVEGHNFFDSHFNPDGNFENHFVDNGNETVTDLATGLMWQKGGSSKAFGDETRVKNFIKDLNEHRFGGFSDWRLPTLEELASLLEPKKATGKSFADPVFSELPSLISADYLDGTYTSATPPWVVDFENGHITIGFYSRIDYLPSALRGSNIPHHKQFVHVKAVRSVK